MSVLPGAIRQIGYIVTDLDQAMQSWLGIGVGPWFVIRGLPMQALYRGRPGRHGPDSGLILAFTLR